MRKKLAALAVFCVAGLSTAYFAYGAVTGPGSEDYDFVVPAQTVTNADGTSAVLDGTLHVHVDVPAPPPPPPPPATYGGIGSLGLLRYAGGLPNTSNLSQYRVVVTDHNLGEDQLAASQPGISLEYSNGMAVSSTQDDGVTLAAARSNNWILKRADGTEYCNSANTLCLVDTGNLAYQQAWAANVSNYITSIPGLDGTFIDNVSVDYHEFSYTGTPVNPATGASLTTAEWQAKQLSFHRYANAYLHSHGVSYIVGNAGAYSPGDVRSNDGSLSVWWWNYLVDANGKSLFDGLFDEHWMFGGGHARLIGTSWDNNWVKYADLVNTAQAVGADFEGEDTGSTAQVGRFGRATFLLNWDCGDGAYIFNSTGDPWSYGVNQNLGCPTGVKTQPQTNVWKRVFANGIVIVNPTSASITQDGHTVASGDAFIG